MGKEVQRAGEILQIATKNLCRESQQAINEVSIISRGESNEISIYQRELPNPQVLAVEIKKLQVAFPKRGADFFNLLTERLIANQFSDQRLKDAVASVVDSFSYKEINISDVIGFDKTVKLYTYSDVCDVVASGGKMSDFEMRDVKGRKMWIKTTDLK